MDKLALLIIDVQTLLIDEKLFKMQAFIANLKKLIDKARANGVPVFYVQHEEPGLEHGTSGWQIYSEIEPVQGETRIYKKFSDSFYQTGLDEKLRASGIGRLVIAGLQTEYCMDTSIRHAFSLGYRSVVAADGHSTLDNGRLTAAQIIEHHAAIWNGRFAKLMTTDEICSQVL